MRHFSRGRRALAAALAFVLGIAGVPAIAGIAPAGVSGRIVRTAGGAAVPGAVVKLALRPDARIYESGKTDARGVYSLSGLPPGTYDVAVESSGGLYVVGAAVALEAGERRSLSLGIKADADAADRSSRALSDEPEPPPTEPPPPEPPKTPPEQPKEQPKEEPKEEPKKEEPKKEEAKAPKKKSKFWRTPWGGAIIVVGSAAIIAAAANHSDKDEPATASPSD